MVLAASQPPPPPPGWEEIEIRPGATSELAELARSLGPGDERTALAYALNAAIRIDISWRIAGVENLLLSGVEVLESKVRYWRTPLAQRRLCDLADAQTVARELIEEILEYFGPAPGTPDPLREGLDEGHDYRGTLINAALRDASRDSRGALALLLGAVVDLAIRIAISEQRSDTPRTDKVVAFLAIVIDALEKESESLRERHEADPLGGLRHDWSAFAKDLLERFENDPATRDPREADVDDGDEPFGDDACSW